MIKYILPMCIVLFFCCQQERVIPSDEVKKAIIEVVTGETYAYMEKDYQKWASYWNHGSEVLRLDVSKDGFAQTRGWDKNGRHLEVFFKEHPEPITSTFVNSNYFIRYDTDLAWVAFDQAWTSQEGVETVAKATITLVNEASSWKIISYTAIQYEAEDDTVDTLGRD